MSNSNNQPMGAGPSASNGQPPVRSIEPPTSSAGIAPAAATPAWQEHLRTAGAWISGQLPQPRVRLCVIGIVLLLLGGLGVASSMWTLPVMIVGAVMVVTAWIGARLNGRFAVEWGESGTQLEFRAKINAPAAVSRPALPAPLTDVGRADLARPIAPAPPFRVATPGEPEPDVIEGQAHTVEIDVAELKALIAAAEAREAQVGTTRQPDRHHHRPAA